MTNTTVVPLQNAYKTTLAASIDSSELTITVTTAPDFTVPAGKKIPIVIDPKNSFREVAYITAISGSDLTVERGKPDYDGGPSTANTHSAGATVVLTNHFGIFDDFGDAIDSKLDSDGGNATTTFDLSVTGSDFRIRKDGSDMKLRDDNQAEVTLSALAAAAGIDDKVKVSSDDTTSGYLNGKITAGDGVDLTENNPGANEDLEVAVDVTDIIDTSAGLTESGNDIQVNLATDPGLEFDGTNGVRVKVKSGGGITRDSDGLSVPAISEPVATGIAGEAIAQGEAIAELPVEVEYYDGLTDADIDLGDANARRRYGVAITPSETYTGTAPFNQIRGKKFASGQDLTVRIETDSSGEPSGTLVDANATATITAASFSTSHTDETVTWGGSFTLTKGTQYWIVFQVASTDGTNYLSLSVNSSHDENYTTHERLTYDLDAGTWGGSATNACPWFWHSSGSQLGMALVVCDADSGRKTWDFVGIADNAYSAGADVTYYNDTVPVDDLGLSLTANKVYYISTTAGELTSTAQAYDLGSTLAYKHNYKIGKTYKDKDGDVKLKIRPGNKRVVVRFNNTAVSADFFVMTWFNNQLVRSLGGTSGGGSAGTGVGNGASSAQFTASGEVRNGQLWYSSGTNEMYISAINDIGVTFTAEESGSATHVFVVEIEQM